MYSLMPRRTVRLAPLIVLALGASPRSGHAQGSLVQVRGVAYDSLRSRPLADAVVSVAGDTRTVRTDSRGRFRFDSIAPGSHVFSAQHSALDSVGFSGISARQTVTDGRAEVLIASPSFKTLWQAVCGKPRAPKDSGFVYGTVRDAVTQAPVPNATVDLWWVELGVSKFHRIAQQRWRVTSRADSIGGYWICGVPLDLGLRLRATTDSAASGLVDLPLEGLRVQRRDLMIGAGGETGMIAGRIADSSGRPIPDARVMADGVAEIRSAEDGRFVVRGVPVGTRQVEVFSIGMSPVVTSVQVMPNDTATVVATMRRITTLDVVRVTASPMVRRLVREFEERRRTGAGYTRDSTEIANHGTLSSVFFEFPSVRVESIRSAGTAFMISMPATSGGRCMANVIIDGRRSDFQELAFLRPGEIAAIEVYPRRMSLPMQFVQNDTCGVVVVWTKYQFG
jgi:protocatechuate 3,4-dioxygenase beta subunit